GRRTLGVGLAGLALSTPVMVAAGCSGTGRELAGLVDPHKVGALVSRTVTVLPRKGAPTPRVAETPSGIVWETGLQNPGLDAFVEQELPRLARTGVPVIVSIGGSSLEDHVRLTSGLHGRPEVAAFEVARTMPEVPVIACGGIRSGEDAIECLLAGAWAVQVGTATLVDPVAPATIAQGVLRYLKQKNLASPADVRGRLRVPGLQAGR